MSDKDQEIAALKARLAELEDVQPLTIKFGNKRNVVVGGPALKQRFPVTLYAPSWIALLNEKERILEFIQEHHDELSWDRD